MYIKDRQVLSIPSYGWTNIDLDGFILRASYLTNVPYDILSAARQYYETGNATIKFNAEGFEYTFYFGRFGFSIHFPDLCEEGMQSLYLDDITPEEFFDCALHDLETDLDAWSEWVYEAESWRIPVESAKTYIWGEIKNVHALIKQKRNSWGEIKPVTHRVESKKAYNRQREKVKTRNLDA